LPLIQARSQTQSSPPTQSGGGETEARRVGQRAHLGRHDLGDLGGQAPAAELLGAGQVEAEQIAVVFSHALILTRVDLYVSRQPPTKVARQRSQGFA
jgi:hypothetical protein